MASGPLIEDEELLVMAEKYNKEHPFDDGALMDFLAMLLRVPMRWFESNKEDDMNKRRKIEKELDTLWSRIIKLTAGGICEKCGSSSGSDAHHIIPKSRGAFFRWKLWNGLCLCRKCHTEAHSYPKRFMTWVVDNLTETRVEKLKNGGSMRKTMAILEAIKESLESEYLNLVDEDLPF